MTDTAAFRHVCEEIVRMYAYAETHGGAVDFDTLDAIVALAQDAIGPDACAAILTEAEND